MLQYMKKRSSKAPKPNPQPVVVAGPEDTSAVNPEPPAPVAPEPEPNSESDEYNIPVQVISTPKTPKQQIQHFQNSPSVTSSQLTRNQVVEESAPEENTAEQEIQLDDPESEQLDQFLFEPVPDIPVLRGEKYDNLPLNQIGLPPEDTFTSD